MSGFEVADGRREVVFVEAVRDGFADLIKAIVNRFWLLGEYPDSGRPSDEIARGVKCFPAGKYLIYYRASREGVDILHVFHGARDQKRAFKRPRKYRT